VLFRAGQSDPLVLLRCAVVRPAGQPRKAETVSSRAGFLSSSQRDIRSRSWDSPEVIRSARTAPGGAWLEILTFAHADGNLACGRASATTQFDNCGHALCRVTEAWSIGRRRSPRDGSASNSEVMNGPPFLPVDSCITPYCHERFIREHLKDRICDVKDYSIVQ
jgi:hypothetical protein